ncbi:hypothetical protein [Haliangium ochraceum]|uniref:Uncharacterized protein n=1 Tax=Haliangium ochraceum (strain DSM 14365 / JCM 11303 / SMP-2) TaxID=502025 RepID=D0LRD4_HALO1|nr:hypothetical protein [Haliangium ochraceum]ACY17162.1 hypothetical protein Hoch_4671 [Haliangium ochraceum DSM 14365]
MGEDTARAYEAYLQRFDAAFGECAFGEFVKHNGQLIQKMDYEAFAPVYLEYCEVVQQYESSISRGDTINDIVVRLLRDRASRLVLAAPH